MQKLGLPEGELQTSTLQLAPLFLEGGESRSGGGSHSCSDERRGHRS